MIGFLGYALPFGAALLAMALFASVDAGDALILLLLYRLLWVYEERTSTP